MIPLGVDTPTSRRAWVTLLLLGLMGAVWLLVQGAGFDVASLASSVRNLGLVPGEITRAAPIGTAVPLGEGMVCVVDAEWVNDLTPFTSPFSARKLGSYRGQWLVFAPRRQYARWGLDRRQT